MDVLDMLGVVIGFSTVMLVLSLIVTALVQTAMHAFRVRTLNLRWGIERLLAAVPERAQNGDEEPPEEQPGEEPREETPKKDPLRERARKDARSVIEKARGLPESKGLLPGWAARIQNPPLTWIEAADLVERLKEAGVEDLGDEEELTRRFGRMERELSGRFAYYARLISIVCAFLVAFGFQLSATRLLSDLSEDRALRENLVGEAQSVYDQATAVVENLPSYEDVSDQALEQLKEKYAKLADVLEEASGMGADRDAVVGELKLILGDEHAEVVAEYEQLLDDLHARAVDLSLAQTKELSTRLAEIDIGFWPHGWGFYERCDHWIGVLMTTILLTLGAPFWFETLGSLLSLRDSLSPDPRKKGKKTPQGDTEQTSSPSQ